MSYLNGTPVEEKLTAIADAIRSKTGKTDKLNLDKMAESIPEVYDKGFEAGEQAGGGGDSYYDTFWDTFQEGGKKTVYTGTFAGNGWTDDIYNPKYPITAKAEASSYLFHNNRKITSTKVPIILEVSGAYVFFDCRALKEIPSIKVTNKVNFSNWFNNCSSLETINFTEDSEIANNIDFSQCSKLSVKSIVSIVESLSGTVSGKTATFKQSAIDNADWSTTNYASWDALKATKTNWTFKNESGTVI